MIAARLRMKFPAGCGKRRVNDMHMEHDGLGTHDSCDNFLPSASLPPLRTCARHQHSAARVSRCTNQQESTTQSKDHVQEHGANHPVDKKRGWEQGWGWGPRWRLNLCQLLHLLVRVVIPNRNGEAVAKTSGRGAGAAPTPQAPPTPQLPCPASPGTSAWTRCASWAERAGGCTGSPPAQHKHTPHQTCWVRPAGQRVLVAQDGQLHRT